VQNGRNKNKPYSIRGGDDSWFITEDFTLDASQTRLEIYHLHGLGSSAGRYDREAHRLAAQATVLDAGASLGFNTDAFTHLHEVTYGLSTSVV
jgi:hypothetical protein